MTSSCKHPKFKLILLSCVFLLTLTQKGLAKKPSYGPIVQFEREHLDLGTVKQGETPRGHFVLQNIGDEPLVIDKITASCGCTAAVMASREIPPGQKSKIEVSVDTTGKEQEIGKTITVTSNDSLRPEIILTLSLQVEPQEHPDFDIATSLFSSRCKSCHVDSGKGLKGKELYHAICYQCHGENGKGASASALNNPQYLKEHDDRYIYDWIAQGQRGTGMAAYARKKEGPLTHEEIDSLVKFIRQLPLQKEEK